MPYSASAGSPRSDTTATMFMIIRVKTPSLAAVFTLEAGPGDEFVDMI